MKGQTSAEARIVAALQAAGLNPARHVFIDNYEMDIVVNDRLVIEVDGNHQYTDKLPRNQAKEEYLEQRGYRLLRIRSTDVHQPAALQHFVTNVQQTLSDKKADMPANTPLALPALESLRQQLEAAEQAKLAAKAKSKPATPATPAKKGDRAIFLDWLAHEPDRDEQAGKQGQRDRSGDKRHR